MPLVIREFVREISPIGVGTAVAFNRRSMKTGKFPEACEIIRARPPFRGRTFQSDNGFGRG